VKKEQKRLLIWILLSFGVYFLGFFLGTTNIVNAPIGLVIMIVGIIFQLAALICAIRLAKKQAEEKENRLKKLESEVEILKFQMGLGGEQK